MSRMSPGSSVQAKVEAGKGWPIDTLVNRHCVSGELKAFACARMLVGCVGQTMQVRREPHQLESLVWNTAPWCERRATSPIPRE